MNKSEMTRITIDIPKKDHRRLKAMAALTGTSMREIIIESLESKLYKERQPNDETIQAIQAAQQEQGLVKAADVEDLFEKLGI